MLLAKCVRPDLRRSAGAIALTVFLTAPLAFAEESHPGLSIEPMYSEAVIAYNKKQTDKALEILNELLKQAPKHVEALQLKALTLKGKGKDAEAEDTYKRLIALKPEKERGPYYFELAVLYHRQHKFAEATIYFHKAIKEKTNVGASNLFLGIMNFTAGKLNEAEENFGEVSSDNDPEMRMVGQYYLGMINLKNGNGSIGTGQMVEARSLSSSIKDSPMAKGIYESTSKMLEPFDRGQFFLTANVLPQYDNNVAQSPVSGAAGSNIATMKMNATGGGGWVSSPMGTWQWVGSLRGTGNLNLNPLAASYQYFTLTPSLYLTYKPLSTTAKGLKLEFNYTLQSTADSNGNYAFRPFSPFATVLEVGPFVRWSLSTRTQLQLDLDFRSATYPTSPDYSGVDPYIRFSWKHESPSRLFNPYIYVQFELDQAATSGTSYFAPALDVNNTMRLDATKTLVLDVPVTRYMYFGSTSGTGGPRQDWNISVHPTFLWNFKPRWSAMADASYTTSSSTDSNYTYNRMMTGIGVSYALQ